MQRGRVDLPAKRGLGDSHHDAALGDKCKINLDSEAPWWQVEEMQTDEESVDHVQHMGWEEMDVELTGSDDDDVDMEPS